MLTEYHRAMLGAHTCLGCGTVCRPSAYGTVAETVVHSPAECLRAAIRRARTVRDYIRTRARRARAVPPSSPASPVRPISIITPVPDSPPPSPLAQRVLQHDAGARYQRSLGRRARPRAVREVRLLPNGRIVGHRNEMLRRARAYARRIDATITVTEDPRLRALRERGVPEGCASVLLRADTGAHTRRVSTTLVMVPTLIPSGVRAPGASKKGRDVRWAASRVIAQLPRTIGAPRKDVDAKYACGVAYIFRVIDAEDRRRTIETLRHMSAGVFDWVILS